MYPVTASQPTSRPDERRRSSRLRVPSIIYAQLGSSYGGIVVNLGMDGIACLTAARLPSGQNLSFDMKLRGAGLNVELTGELVWLGATQKKAGIRFKNLSAEARKEISDWIARESQLFGPIGMDAVSPMDSRSGSSAGSQNYCSRPFSVAPAVSPATPANPDEDEFEDEQESKYERPSASLSQYPVITPGTLAGNPAGRDAVLNVDSSAARSEFHGAPPPQNDALFDPMPIEKPYQFPTQTLSPAISDKVTPPMPASSAKTDRAKVEETKTGRAPSAAVSSEPGAVAGKAAPAASEKPRLAAIPAGKSEPAKTKVADPVRSPAAAASKAPPAISQEKPALAKTPAGKSEISKAEKIAAPVSVSAQNAPPIATPGSDAADLWIPQGLREAWNRADSTQRYLMVGVGVACVGSFVLILILTIFQVSRFSSPSVPNVSPAAASTSAVVADSSDAAADSSAPPAGDSDEPASPSPFISLVRLVFGIKSNLDESFMGRATAIDRAHVAVPVWTSKTSGYYYCTDDQYYKLVRPGSFMTQRDALQNGYQPKLGKFCD